MRLHPGPIALVLFASTTLVAAAAHAQPPAGSSAATAQPAPAAMKSPLAIAASHDWIMYDDTTYSPVVDPLTQHLSAARKAFDAKDSAKAASEMRAVAAELKRQAGLANLDEKTLVGTDREILVSDRQLAREAVKRLHAASMKAESAADAIAGGRIKTAAELDRAIGKAARADMDHRWLVTDVTAWYPVSEEPQRHFTSAVAAYARKDYQASATDIRKAASFMRLEAGRASGSARKELDGSIAQLGTLAASVEKGTSEEEHAMAHAFAKADHALALEHRAKAADAWARKEYEDAGYEFKAAAQGLDNAAGWAGAEARQGASATVEETRALGDKLASGAAWTRDEVGKGFESLGKDLNVLGRRIGGTRHAPTISSNA